MIQIPTRKRYVRIVFLDGDEGRDRTDELYNVEGVVNHGATAESITGAIGYLTGWDYADADDVHDERTAGANDDTWQEGEYILTANSGLGYIGLERVIEVPDSDAPLDVWLRFVDETGDSYDDVAESEANIFAEDRGFTAKWYHTAVGLVSDRWFATYDEAAAFLAAEGFQDFSS